IVWQSTCRSCQTRLDPTSVSLCLSLSRRPDNCRLLRRPSRTPSVVVAPSVSVSARHGAPGSRVGRRRQSRRGAQRSREDVHRRTQLAD
ncbi:unnamed protein product, partial [Callosobruchus maculatus]